MQRMHKMFQKEPHGKAIGSGNLSTYKPYMVRVFCSSLGFRVSALVRNFGHDHFEFSTNKECLHLCLRVHFDLTMLTTI